MSINGPEPSLIIRGAKSGDLRVDLSCDRWRISFSRALAMFPITRDTVAAEMPRAVCISLCRRSEEHTSELQSLMRISYAVFCLKKKTKHNSNNYARQLDQ